MTRKKFVISTDDFYRVLITETLPYEVPLIYSNEGIYNFYKAFEDGQLTPPDIILKLFGLSHNIKAKQPFSYKISKDINSVRALSLIHPAVQNEFVSFYRDNDSLINFYCSKSEFSLRYPKKVASTVYELRNNETYNFLSNVDDELRDEMVELVGEDKRKKFSSNYFSYKKVNILYKFFESSEFIRLEKKFNRMSSLDISRCFDTVYTHSLAWAVKDKDYIKKHVTTRQPHSFEDNFDCLIRKANDNETNGIVIGPEFSRIYTEIILQQIDQNIEKELLEKKLVHNRDYAIRRYIDDYYIFSKSEFVDNCVKSVVIDKLWEYKFRINPSKTKSFIRPFTTERSRNIIDLRTTLDNKFKTLLEKHENDKGKKFFIIKNINHTLRASTSFIKEIKSCWHNVENVEAGFSNYVLSTMLSQYLTFIKYAKNNPNPYDGNSIVNFSIFILDIAHYCFALKPKVSESYKFCQLVIIMSRFVTKEVTDYSDKLNHKIQESLLTLLKNELSESMVCGVEKFNVLLTLASVDRSYLPEPKVIDELVFNSEGENSYFNIIIALFISSNDIKYEKIKNKAQLIASQLFDKCANIYYSTEAIHLFLDLMSCPFIKDVDKIKICEKALLKLNEEESIIFAISQNNLKQKSIELYNFLKNKEWFVSWHDVDLLLKLQRKLLRESY